MTATEKDVWIGFDLGGTKMLAKVFDSDFKSLGQARTKTKGYEGVKAGIDRITSTVRSALKSADIDAKDLSGIGIGCPGPLDLEEGIILSAPNLGWSGVHIKKHLEEEFSCPTIIVNDVDAGVYGEYRFGAAAKARTALGVFPGTGIGGGCVYDGQIIRGKTTSCMEIGHVQVVPHGPLCGCGHRGCLEAVASRLVIAAQCSAAAYRGQAPYLMKNVGTDLKDIRSGALSAAISAGDKQVERIVRDAAKHIGYAVASMVNVLAPDVVVLGGGLVEAMTKLFIGEVRHTAKDRVMPALFDAFDVVPAELGDNAGVIGAAAWAEHELS